MTPATPLGKALAEETRGLPDSTGLRRWLGVATGGGRTSATTLTFRQYWLVAAGGLVLTAVQLIVMPRWLTARSFGVVVLATAATQAVLQVGDLGLVRLCVDVRRPPEERSRLRTEGQSLSIWAAIAMTVVVGLLWPANRSHSGLLIALALGAVAGALAAADKFRAARCEVAGDQVGAAVLNFLWTNGPKIGLLLGLLAFRQPAAILCVTVFVTALLCAPYVGKPGSAWAALRRPRSWLRPLVAILASYLLIWIDTFFLAARLGVAGAGAYEALYRVLGVCTYIFMPWVSVLTSRVSTGTARPVRRPLMLALVFTIAALGGLTIFAWRAAPRFFPHLDLPMEALPGLLCFYVLLPVSYCFGSALYVRGRTDAVMWASLAAVVVGLAGHIVFTLHGGPAQAAWVSAATMAVAAAIQGQAYRSTLRRG